MCRHQIVPRAEDVIGTGFGRRQQEPCPGRIVSTWVVRSADDGRAADLEYGLLRGFEARYPGRSWEGTGGTRILRTADRAIRFRRAGKVIELRIAPSAVDAALEKSSSESAPSRAPKGQK